MTLRDWCAYDYYYATRTEDGLQRDACSHCNLQDACNCCLHCNYDVFSVLTKMKTKGEVDEEMARMKSYYNAPLPPHFPRQPSLRGKYFWERSCSGQGPQKGYKYLDELKYTLNMSEEELPLGEDHDSDS